MGIIYKATNKIAGKYYVGKSEKNLNYRKRLHYTCAFKKYSKTYFHNALRSYGISSFKWNIIDSGVTGKQLCRRERFWITILESKKKGYNLADGGTGGKTGPMSKKTKEKLRISGKKPNKGHFKPNAYYDTVLTYNTLYKDYIVNDLSVEKISVKYKISKVAISSRLKKYSITKRNLMKEAMQQYDKILTKDILYLEYIKNNKSTTEIAKKYNIKDTSSILSRLKKYKIKVRPSGFQSKNNRLTKKVLIDEYTNNKLSSSDIAKKYNIKCKSSVILRLKKFNIKIRETIIKENIGKLTKDILEKEYIQNKLSIDKISYKYNISRNKVWYRLVKFNISRRPFCKFNTGGVL